MTSCLKIYCKAFYIVDEFFTGSQFTVGYFCRHLFIYSEPYEELMRKT